MKTYSIQERTFEFAVEIVLLYKKLRKQEDILCKQLVRSGTSIGANAAEANSAHSKADFISKLSISEKESSETDFWLRLLHRTDYINQSDFVKLHSENDEILRILKSIIKNTKQSSLKK